MVHRRTCRLHLATAEMGQRRASDNQIEIALRKLASHSHFDRTGDVTAAQGMLALQPPGQKAEVAPRVARRVGDFGREG